ncbi:MAG TPA: 3-deoxy-D-manno-octulosonic acid transferase [Planctomycetaceae bacterium]|nr:3-deoxy-D-manno-octulosonic acid transferase [Blastopirellula sp.]HAY80673.1 3-deoxy-D-manno-octulosonic acid transferase [Planctomycetaceae bacterium]
MAWILNCCYLALACVASPWILYQAWRKGKYREGYAEKLLGRVPQRVGDGPCVWLHAVSAGEVNLVVSLLKVLQARHPDVEYFVSTTTKTGHAIATSKLTQCTVFYCPLDFSWAVRAAMRRVRPTVLVLSELELWPNLIWSAEQSGASVCVINGRLSAKSYRGYRRCKPLVASVLRSIDRIAVQNATYAERFRDLGATAEQVVVTGSMKYDGACTRRENIETLRLGMLAGITRDDVVFLAGSTQAPEEERALATYLALREQFPELRLILVPRHPERFEAVARMLQQAPVEWQRRSELDGTRNAAARVLLVDAMGELGAWWGTAEIAFVGGSMGSRGGQNMIEPAAYGAAVSFGPNTRNFRDIVSHMLAADAAVVVHDQADLTAFVARCLGDADFQQDLGLRAQRLVQQNLGATDKTVALLEPLMLPDLEAEKRLRQAG